MKFKPRFSLRMLLLLVTFAGMAMGWVIYQFNWIRQPDDLLVTDKFVCPLPSNLPLKAPWTLRLFGESPRWAITVDSTLVEEAKRLFPEARVSDIHELEGRAIRPPEPLPL